MTWFDERYTRDYLGRELLGILRLCRYTETVQHVMRCPYCGSDVCNVRCFRACGKNEFKLFCWGCGFNSETVFESEFFDDKSDFLISFIIEDAKRYFSAKFIDRLIIG